MPYSKQEKAEIWLDSFGLDYAKKIRLYSLCETPYGLVSRLAQEERAVKNQIGETAFAAMARSLEDARCLEKLLGSYEEKRIVYVTFSSERYPEALKQIPNPPTVLYCRGDVSLLRTRKFAVVGSRRMQPAMLECTRRFAREIAAHFTIVTGTADGGDTAAATGALEGGKVIAVLAYGLDHVYPACNRNLLRAIEERGLLVSEHLPFERPRAYYFPVRNRIIAGLSEGVLVTGGGEKSGTRITADCAYSYGRDVFAFPYGVGVPSGAGCNAILKEYAKLTDNLVDIFDAFGINLTATDPVELTSAESAVYRILQEGTVHVSEIAQRSGLKPHELPAVLTMLEMKGLAVSCGGNRYAAVR